MNLQKRRTAPKCANCGKYQVHEDLTAVNTDDGVVRICPTCLNDKVNDGSGKTWKALSKQQWSEACKQMDEIIAKSRISFPPQDALAKARGQDRLAKAYDNAMAYLRSMAVPPRSKTAADRVASLAKAEITRRKTAELVAKTKRDKRKLAKLRRRTDEMELAKGQAEQMLADLLATQAAATAQLDEIARRVDVVCTNAQRAYGAVNTQRDIQRTAELARQDQVRADWHFKAGQTSDPDLRRYYLAKAAGENPDED